MNSLITPLEMTENRALIEAIYKDFSNRLDNQLAANGGMINHHKLETVIRHTMKGHKLSVAEKRVVQAFFDAYVGMWATMGDRRDVEELVNTLFFNSDEDAPRVYF